MLLQEKFDNLRRILQSYGRVALAYSGGVDSSLLLKCSLETLGAGNVLVLHNRSVVQKQGESDLAMDWLRRHGLEEGVETKITDSQPLDFKDFVLNSSDRCYSCKLRVYGLFADIADGWGSHVLVDGTNTDDLKDTRPGLRAIHELGVKTPFVESGFCKDDIRQLSREFKLDTWDRPSASCLATRIPFGMEITPERLAKIDAWETFLQDLGFNGCRVRLVCENLETVNVQVQIDDFEKLLSKPIRLRIIRHFQKQGIGKVYLDMTGR